MEEKFHIVEFEYVSKKDWDELEEFIDKELERLEKWMDKASEESIRDLRKEIEDKYRIFEGLLEIINGDIDVLRDLHDDAYALVEITKASLKCWRSPEELIKGILGVSHTIRGFLQDVEEKRKGYKEYLRYIGMLRSKVLSKLYDIEQQKGR